MYVSWISLFHKKIQLKTQLGEKKKKAKIWAWQCTPMIPGLEMLSLAVHTHDTSSGDAKPGSHIYDASSQDAEAGKRVMCLRSFILRLIEWLYLRGWRGREHTGAYVSI